VKGQNQFPRNEIKWSLNNREADITAKTGGGGPEKKKKKTGIKKEERDQ
jgi:hypothetical protein